MDKKEFSVLTELEKGNFSLEEYAENNKISVDELNSIINDLKEKGFIENGSITSCGLEALEPYRVKRAIFIAAGMGTRMMPVTINTPKPLVRVNGTRIIDSLIDACVEAEVEEIIVVRGYLGEVFDQLKYKYPNIQFVDNPKYEYCNNISSAYLVKEKMENAYIFESDLFLINKSLITKYQYKSNYLGVSVEKTPDWCFDADENGKITDLHKGGKNCWHMYGVAYYDKATAQLFAKRAEEIFFNTVDGKNRFYDDVLCHFYASESEIYVRECTFEDIEEIDTFDELCEIDEMYTMRT